MYVDKFLFPENKLVYVNNHAKIEENLKSFSGIYEKIQTAKVSDESRLRLVFHCSDHIISLSFDLTPEKKSHMHFFDRNMKLFEMFVNSPAKEIFSKQEVIAILKCQVALINNPRLVNKHELDFTDEELV